MKKYIPIRDTWHVIDIDIQQLQVETVNALRNFGVVYRDTNDLHEHLISPREVLENEIAMSVEFVKNSESELKELAEVLDKNDAFYMRIVEI